MTTSVFALDEVSLGQRLAEAIAWCTPRVRLDDPKTCLRSDDVRPWLLAPDRPALVSCFLRHRASTLFPSRPAPIAKSGEMQGGRLLIYFPDQNLSDGAAEVVSKGFFDVENSPPWDTWVGLGVDAKVDKDPSFQTYLVSWVPPQFIEYVSAGIRVNPEECIAWIDDVAIGAHAEAMSRRLLNLGGGRGCDHYAAFARGATAVVEFS